MFSDYMELNANYFNTIGKGSLPREGAQSAHNAHGF
jgi:hypothetical protein